MLLADYNSFFQLHFIIIFSHNSILFMFLANYNRMAIIGRFLDKALFNKLLESDKSSFVAMYGRRRIGKTYLIGSKFENFTFSFTI